MSDNASPRSGPGAPPPPPRHERSYGRGHAGRVRVPWLPRGFLALAGATASSGQITIPQPLPAWRESGTAKLGRMRDLAGRLPAKEAPLEQILLRAHPRVRHLRERSDGALVLEQTLEHADRRVVRRPYALRCIAVPAAVLELLAEKTTHQILGRTAEVGTEREGAAVDARLDLAVEERLRAKRLVPAESCLKARHRGGDIGVGGIGAGRT